MTARNKTTLKSNINSNIPNNTTQAVSATDVRTNMIDLADSLVFNNGETAQAIEGSVRTRRPVVSVAGTSKTFSLSDANTTQHCSNGAAQTLTIPTNASVAFAIGDRIAVRQVGVGVVTVQGAAGVDVNGTTAGSEAVPAQYGELVAEKIATDGWALG